MPLPTRTITMPKCVYFPGAAMISMALLLAACAATEAQVEEPVKLPFDATAPATYDGLRKVDSKHFDLAYARPDVQFGNYDSIILDAPELAFRTPDRSQREFPLQDEQRTRLLDVLSDAFGDELAKMRKVELVTDGGPKTLRLKVRLENIAARAAPRTAGGVGRSAIALEAVGEATLILQLHDSETDEVLARVVDRKTAEGLALAIDGELVSRWDSIEKLAEHWARLARRRIDAVLGT